MSKHHIICLDGMWEADEMYQTISAGKEVCERCGKQVKKKDRFMLCGYPINKHNFRIHLLCGSCGTELKEWSEKFAGKEQG